METFNEHLEILASHVFDNDKLVISIFDIVNFQVSLHYFLILFM
jgi:hypothetical protein